MYPREYIQFLAHFHGDRDYFECHEILEEYWKKTDPGKKESIWVGLIQLAVSAYHHRRGNFNGAKKTLEKAIIIIETQADSVIDLGLSKKVLSSLLNERLSVLKRKASYTSFNIPILDPVLAELCKIYCNENDLVWGQESDLTDIGLVNRHKLRDRSDVIKARYQSLQMRKGSE